MTTSSTPLAGVDLVLADLDGVVYKGPRPIPHAIESLNRVAETGRVGYITNNAARTAASVAAHLTNLGLSVTADDVVTSPQAAVKLLAELVPSGATVLVVGGEGLVDEVEKAGFIVTRSAEDDPAAVIQGFSPEVGWTQLAEASYALHGGIPWVSTNTDWTIPQERGVAPGNGTLVSAVHTAVGRMPVTAGKPETPIFHAAVERFGAEKPLFIGDRLDTDIRGANRVGMDSVLVLTGIDGAKQVLAATAEDRPTYIVEDLRELHDPYPVADVADDGTVTVRDSVVVMRGNRLEVLREGGSSLDLLRAASRAIWNSGLAIYGIDVPGELFDRLGIPRPRK
ncbi:HAD-IIA family hydrolase [Salinibacterium sp. ZJ450]|uniref:HAD-IIA family hydrolase n=1 Tax=Salinibacterium sp. ZJ450 TaxID=2708338 RepID=UPI001CD617E8|nr:HAD-IIA family hydrolase [Salinibacterium sp. ZJ450]